MNRYEHAIECLTLAEKRNDTLGIMLFERDYNGVVCQSAEIVDLTLEGVLQYAGAEVDLSDGAPNLDGALEKLSQVSRRDRRRMHDIHSRIGEKRRRAQEGPRRRRGRLAKRSEPASASLPGRCRPCDALE